MTILNFYSYDMDDGANGFIQCICIIPLVIITFFVITMIIVAYNIPSLLEEGKRGKNKCTLKILK